MQYAGATGCIIHVTLPVCENGVITASCLVFTKRDQHIRGFLNVIRCINPRFTYLLTYCRRNTTSRNSNVTAKMTKKTYCQSINQSINHIYIAPCVASESEARYGIDYGSSVRCKQCQTFPSLTYGQSQKGMHLLY